MDKIKLSPLIDADLLLYRCGFAADAQAKREGKEGDDYVQWALENTRTTIDAILHQFPEADYSKLYLTGKFNFRDKVATMLPYKGNRDPSHKPKYYQEVRDYLVGVWGAEVIDNMEADDAIGMAQWAKPDRSTIIVSTDKDMLMIPGNHYNWVKGTFSNVGLKEANQNFYRQMLEGDRTDNIPGINGVGPVTVNKLFEDTKGDLGSIKNKVIEYYDKQYGLKSKKAYHEVATLLFIKREKDKNYNDYGL